jgi:predicted GNAT family acetyltransferase
MDIATDDLEVIDNQAAQRFEIRIGDDVAFLQYVRSGATIAYTHTEVPPSLEGHGIAAKLATHALDYARANGLEVVPLCPYVADYIERHPAYRDLVAPRAQWRQFLQR